MPPPSSKDDAPASCANCAAGLDGPYCGQCGQHVADYHRSVWRFLTDFLDNTFCWDNKFLRTLTPLVRQPGFLTREFMAGRRVRYVHPLRLFLFTSAVCLTLVGFLPHQPPKFVRRGKAKDGKIEYVAPAAKAAADEADADDDQDETPPPGPNACRDRRANYSPPPRPRQPNRQRPSRASGSASRDCSPSTLPERPGLPPPLRHRLRSPPRLHPPSQPTKKATSGHWARPSAGRCTKAGWLRSPDHPPPGQTTPAANAYEKRIDKVINRSISLAEAATAEQQRAQTAGEMAKMISGSQQAGKMVEATLQGIKARLSWVGLALLPVFALFLRAVYWREDAYYFAHLVFSLHYHAFLFVFWVTWACLDFVLAYAPLAGLWGFLLGCSLLLPGWYLFVALRRLYGDSPRRTALKVLLLGSLHLLSILIGVASVGALAFFSAQK